MHLIDKQAAVLFPGPYILLVTKFHKHALAVAGCTDCALSLLLCFR